MVEHFNPHDILKIAVKVRENAKDLYKSLELKAPNEELRILWRYLGEDSELHRKVFQAMCDDPGDYVVYELLSGEYDQYLQEVIPNFRYAQETIAKKIKVLFESDLEAVEFSIYIVIESILVYSTLKDYIVPEKIDLFNKIIGDEKKHLARLNLMKRRLMK